MGRKGKIGVNEPCWCGSGKKFKKCHRDREQQNRLTFWEAGERQKAAFNNKYCSCPEVMKASCGGSIVQAHTVSRSASLKSIARDGHVYAFSQDFVAFIKDGVLFKPKLVGISKASTFTGFCNVHDNNLFSSLEKVPFECSPEQCLLIAYRALSKELFAKLGAIKTIPVMRDGDRGRPIVQQFELQEVISGYEMGSGAALNSLQSHKKTYDECLVKQDYRLVRYYGLRLHDIPDVMGSGGIFPECDFNGNVLQDLSDLSYRPDSIFFSVFSSDGDGWIVFSWLIDSEKSCLPLVSSFHQMPEEEKPDAMVRFLFEFCENVYFAPKWWERLTVSTQNALLDRSRSGASMMKLRKSGCLKSDSRSYVKWSIAECINNLDFHD